MNKDNLNVRLQSARIRNFKAIVDSRTVRFGSLTVFIGHNGSGKSSLIEGMETYQAILREGLDLAMQRWLGMEHVRHKGLEAKEQAGRPVNPMAFDFSMGTSPRRTNKLHLAVNIDPAANRYLIQEESLNGEPVKGITVPGHSALLGHAKGHPLADQVLDWQFLTLAPERMGQLQPQRRTGGLVRLAKDGSNIADYLLDIQRLDVAAFDGIVRTMRYVLPYARDLQPSLTSELERKAYLQLAEGNFKVPGWMLSTGTLRVLGLLAVLRHPRPSPLIVVEEIENGLDPRSIHLLVEEMRTAVLSGVTQVLLTTHSPYLLDLLKLDQLVLVARDEKGEPRFSRPADDARLAEWAKEFAPGRLYTMGSLHEVAQ